VATQIKNFAVQIFKTYSDDGTLQISPDIQRREVWTAISKMMLVDSIAREVPIGAITLYEDSSQNFKVYEVIDGKQRLTALLSYMRDEFELDEAKLAAAEDDEIANVGKDQAEPFYGKVFSALEVAERKRLLQYEIPVFVVSGARGQAVQAFTRMNRNSYVLKPQEIRNAVYANSAYLKAAVSVTEDFRVAEDTEIPGLVAMRVVSQDGYQRMQDIQFAAELLALALEGEQHRRDSLNEFFDKYREDRGEAWKRCKEKQKVLGDAMSQVSEIFDGGSPLSAFHFPGPGSCENDFYALIGALLERGTFSRPVMTDKQEAIRDGVSEFRRQVKLFVEESRQGTPSEDVPEVVRRYGQTLLGGQLNSKTRRIERRQALIEILDGVADAPADRGFSPAIRDLIWASQAEKVCARCGKPVA